ncbi:5'-nucleotidase [Breoghania corrubedonensis]|uniref:5'-nucleotidase n=1 Tax=Breoghania corrubedonensis TaxID=665038 RepID=A0A2T5V5T7_9HYPH|nr:bifunctional metallophosphatase/5'-nucleotidase [Breoghania corrubedonensis]PTW59114.1 5'-nucleotidase [Breoghania corrubedonensis]
MKTALVFSAAIVAGLVVGGAARADYALTILHTNDFHSRIEPINKYDSTCSAKDDQAGKCFGGSARFMTAITQRRDAIRTSGGNVILLDGGDQFQGSLFYTRYKGKVAAELMNRIGYDAMVVGNHEFDDGPKVLSDFINAIHFPILLANADFSGEAALKDKLKGAVVIDVGGEKIGLIGVTAEDTGELSSPGKDVRFLDAVATLKGAVQAFEAAGIDRIVVLSHSGYQRDKQLAALVPGIDVIVGGHSHTYLANSDDKAEGPYPTFIDTPEGGKTAIVQAYAYGKFLGEVNVVWNDAGELVSAAGAPVLMDAGIAQDEGTSKRVAELAAPLDELRNQIVGRTSAPIDGSRDVCRKQECEMGDLVADAMLARVRDQGIDIAIQNGGGLRASIDAGDVTMGEVLSVLPFQNTLATFRLKGSDVLVALENGFSQVEDVAGRFPQVAGMKVVWDAARPAGSRVVSVEVISGDGYVALDREKLYGVVSNNYMRQGGDGYSVFAKAGRDAYDYGPNLEDVVADHIDKANGYEPATDGRIRRMN